MRRDQTKKLTQSNFFGQETRRAVEVPSYKRDAANLIANRIMKKYREYFCILQEFAAFQEVRIVPIYMTLQEVQAQTRYNSKFNINEAFNNFKHKQHAKQENPLTKSDNQRSRKQTFQDKMFLSNDKNIFNGAATMRTRPKDKITTPANNVF